MCKLRNNDIHVIEMACYEQLIRPTLNQLIVLLLNKNTARCMFL
jgi:hypothetical protein